MPSHNKSPEESNISQFKARYTPANQEALSQKSNLNSKSTYNQYRLIETQRFKLNINQVNIANLNLDSERDQDTQNQKDLLSLKNK